MEDLEKKVLVHLGRINCNLLTYYVNNVADAENNTVLTSQRDYENKYGGSYRSISRYKQILRNLGLILPLGQYMRILPLEETTIGKICLRYSDFNERHKIIDALICPTVGQTQSSDPIRINNLAEKSDNRVAYKTVYNNNSKDNITNITPNTNINITATILSYMEKNMATKEQVKQIWDSWNNFVLAHSTVGVSRMTKKVRYGTDVGSSSIYNSIAQWIEDNGDEWWEIWEEFIDKAKKNTWLQSKEGFSVTLNTVFCGTTNDPTPVIIKAMEGKYDGWNLKVIGDLDQNGKATETKLEEFRKGMKGMTMLGEIE